MMGIRAGGTTRDFIHGIERMSNVRPPAVFLALAFCAPVLVGAEPPGIDLAGMDTSVAPGDDFFAHANGTWFKTTEIPADKPSYGAGWVVFDLTTQRTAELIRQAKGPRGSVGRKIGDYYASYLDADGIEAKGLKPLQPTLDRIGAIADRKALSRYLGSTVRADVDALNATNFYTDNILGLWVAADLENPTRYVPFLLQGGLDMPDRDYYVDPSDKMKEIRARHRAHVAAMLTLARVADAEAKAQRIADLERLIAEAHATRTESMEVKQAQRWARTDFDTRAPGIDWAEFLSAARLDTQPEFMVWHPRALPGISALVAGQPLETWKEYLVFHALEHSAGVLPEAFGAERFAFHGTVLSGTPQRRQRALRAVDNTNFALGEAVGQLYVKRYFPPAAKARAEAMVKNLIAAFGRRVDQITWMTPATKARAKAKLAVLRVGVGYPDRWRDYSGLEIVRGDAFGNDQRAELFDYAAALRKLGQPVDRGEWVMTPQTVNAVNLPVLNAMNFPAAILQPPYFDPSRPEAMDYGAIGSVIGHEISHSFDDQGAQFDDQGRLRNWWTDEDRKHFEEASARLVKQYDAYKVFPDLNLNGTLTLSENIADVAGLAVAYDGYRLSLKGKPAPVVAGLSGDQQFFIAFAQAWRAKTREPALRQQVVTDGHAPDEFRADTVRNLDAWYAAFDVKPGQKLYLAPAERVQVW
jgi:predicted metalloendopeptidase